MSETLGTEVVCLGYIHEIHEFEKKLMLKKRKRQMKAFQANETGKVRRIAENRYILAQLAFIWNNSTSDDHSALLHMRNSLLLDVLPYTALIANRPSSRLWNADQTALLKQISDYSQMSQHRILAEPEFSFRNSLSNLQFQNDLLFDHAFKEIDDDIEGF